MGSGSAGPDQKCPVIERDSESGRKGAGRQGAALERMAVLTSSERIWGPEVSKRQDGYCGVGSIVPQCPFSPLLVVITPGHMVP